MKSYSTVIFDLDGTLLNTLEDLTNATNQALRECGYPEHTMEDVKGFVGNGIGMLIRRALPPECDADPEAYEMTLQAFKRYYFLHNNDTTAPYPGIPELIDALQEKGLKLAVVSNKNDPNVKALCQYYFPSIPLAVGEREGIRRKPEPDTVLHVMNEFGSAKCHTLYVGDSDVDGPQRWRGLRRRAVGFPLGGTLEERRGQASVPQPQGAVRLDPVPSGGMSIP